MENKECIYCKRSFSEVLPSVSDIIPFAFISGKKLILKNSVCVECNNLVNRIAEDSIIRKFESLRRRINAISRRGDVIPNQYIIKFKNDNIELETNPIKSDNADSLFTKPLYFQSKEGKGTIIGPYEKVQEIASKKGESDKLHELGTEDTKFSVLERYAVPIGAFFTREMKTMVAKICFEWLMSIWSEADPLNRDYDIIRDAIITNSVDEANIVDITTNVDIAKSLFEDLFQKRDEGISEFIPQKLLVGDYYLFFEIKDDKLHCYFAFMGMVLYRVLVTTKNLPNTEHNLLISEIHKYKGRTGELEMLVPHYDTWPELSFHLDQQKNYNNMEDYIEYLQRKIQELIQFRIDE